MWSDLALEQDRNSVRLTGLIAIQARPLHAAACRFAPPLTAQPPKCRPNPCQVSTIA